MFGIEIKSNARREISYSPSNPFLQYSVRCVLYGRSCTCVRVWGLRLRVRHVCPFGPNRRPFRDIIIDLRAVGEWRLSTLNLII